MKITLHYPEGTSQTYTDCSTLVTTAPELGFIGTDWRRVTVKMLTTLPYTITEELPIETARQAAAVLRDSIKGTCGACKG
jgi:hypothetical protein